MTLRVLQVAHTFLPDSRTGTEVHTLELTRALLTHEGVEAAVFAPRRDREEATGPARTGLVREEVSGLDCFRALHADGLRPDRNPVVEGAFSEVLDRFRPDLVHFQHCAWGGEGLPVIARERGVPSVLTLHDYWSICPRATLFTAGGKRCAGPGRSGERCLTNCWLDRPGKTRMRKLSWILDRATGHRLPVPPAASGLLEGRSFREAWIGRPDRMRALLSLPDALIAPSEHVANRYLEWGVEPDRLVRIPHGVDTSWAGRVRRDTGSAPPVRFGFIGTPLPHKGLHLLLDAFAGLPEGSATLAVHASLDASEDPYAEGLLTRIRALPAVRAAGPFDRADLPGVFGEMDVLVVPSVWEEMFGLVVLEARLGGVAVVVSESGGLPELVRNRVDGLVVPPDRVAPLHRALQRFVDDPGLAARLARAAPAVRTVEACADDTLRLYSRVLNGYGSEA